MTIGGQEPVTVTILIENSSQFRQITIEGVRCVEFEEVRPDPYSYESIYALPQLEVEKVILTIPLEHDRCRTDIVLDKTIADIRDERVQQILYGPSMNYTDSFIRDVIKRKIEQLKKELEP